jgi:hypothetical protein
MPLYDCVCDHCERGEEQFMLPSQSPEPCSVCGKPMRRLFTAGSSMLIPPHMRASFSPSPDHEKWFHSDETQARIKRGELEPLKKSADPYQ